MTKPNYKAMTQLELKQYIFTHRDDKDAIHEAVLRIQKNGTALGSSDDLKQFIEQKRLQDNNS
ncbi:hypothetical protein NIES267_48350 [Calothrix parasitica NIES-267]|uniref:Uncharacterized protein n=1 Tax=Calothrix parasitica NIES-267 TaxID=1973488 RepID=A0A1Z4LVQ0_9CYAN|nr:hypothetical protein NIES267_48350 [Calothrix parasitica NIES-267]